MKKLFKKTSSKIGLLCFSMLLVLNIVMPIVGVSAAEYGSGSFELQVGIDNSDLTNGEVTSVVVNTSPWSNDGDIYKTDNGQNTIVVTITGEEGYSIGLRKGGDSPAVISEPDITDNTYVFTVTYNTANQHDYLSLYPYSEDPNANPGGGDPGQGPGSGSQTANYMVNFGTASWVVGETTVAAEVAGKTINNGNVEIAANDVIQLNNYNDETMRVKVEGISGFNTYLIVNEQGQTGLNCLEQNVYLPNENLTFTVEEKTSNEPDPGQGGGEPGVTGGPNDIEFDIAFTNTHMNVWINNVTVMSDADGLRDSFEGTIEGAGVADENETNTLKFQNSFGDLPVTVFVINGVTYDVNEENPNINVVGDESSVTAFITVPGASKYTITGTADTSYTVPRTIIWTNPGYVPKPGDTEEWLEEFSLEHGSAYIVAVYDGETLVSPEEYANPNWNATEVANGIGNDHFGWAQIAPGNKVIFEFVPDYGYQLTDIRINGQKLGLSNTINQFEFTMPDTNIHFDAEFTKTEDVVKADSDKVASGSIDLGNTLSGGSAQLTVTDADDLDADKIKGFEEKAGDYTITNYLDIDLYQVFYKGKNDANDVWKNKIDELDNEATITIKLEDGLTADDIVIVHNVHDGDEYEIIEIESYDPETNTITFKTRSFSSYAIAAKTTTAGNNTTTPTNDTAKTNNPKTSDNILIYILLGIFALAGLSLSGIALRKKYN